MSLPVLSVLSRQSPCCGQARVVSVHGEGLLGCRQATSRATRATCTSSQTSTSLDTSGHRIQACKEAGPSRRQAVAAVLAASLLTFGGAAQAARDAPGDEANSTSAPATVYFGNGCFWGRQKDFVDVEKRLGRQGSDVSATAGYAGSSDSGPRGQVCYYYGPRNSVYETLGHAEVVQLELGQLNTAEARRQMGAFADTYFAQFRRTPIGMIRLDPQDSGPAYRNIIGLPGGMSSPLFGILKERNVNGMQLVAGSGNTADEPEREGDAINRVYVVDSSQLPFHKAELFHQYHNGIGKAFGNDYTRTQKQIARQAGRIGQTGCPELVGSL